MEKYVCIHGHFYQPPRENPWLEEIEMQDSAYPYHDWNERITAECYEPNTASRILSPEGMIIDIVNNYSKISFNFGPTLLSWMEKYKPDTYRKIIEADKLSMERFSGHGSALAQVFNHIIMPLANEADKRTQVIWGIKDFEKRFGRYPEGIWLAETAVDIATLEILAENNISFTILAPRQAKAVRKMVHGAKWEDVSEGRVDPTMAYLCPLPSGRTINIFFYDGPISQSIAFGGLLNNGKNLADKLVTGFDDSRSHNQLVHIATDGESYGHHHSNGDMALAYCLHYIESNDIARITNYGEYLEKHPPAYEAQIFENSSWSCGHGIERWRDNCGCNSGREGWHQEWRRPLRESLDFLRDEALKIFEEHAGKFFSNPQKARDRYIKVILDRDRKNTEAFFNENGVKKLEHDEKIKALKLMEMQRNSMLMYTSCGWFFDEVSGLETVQVLQYAAKVIQYAEEFAGSSLEAEFVKMLEETPSNIHGNSVYIYENYVRPVRLDLGRVGAHYAISSLFENYLEDTAIGAYTAKKEIYNLEEAGKQKLLTGKMKIISDVTWEEETFAFSVLHLGDNNINCGIKKFETEEQLNIIDEELHSAFNRGDISEVIRLMAFHFGDSNYSLLHLFRDQQRKILDQIMQLTYEGVEASYRQIYENNYNIMSFLQTVNIPLPKQIFQAAGFIINTDIKRIFEAEEIEFDKLANLIKDAEKWSVELDKDTIRYVVNQHVNRLMEDFSVIPDLEKLEKINSIFEIIKLFHIKFRLWKAQNIYFPVGKETYPLMLEKADNGDTKAKHWVELFNKVGDFLKVDISE